MKLPALEKPILQFVAFAMVGMLLAAFFLPLRYRVVVPIGKISPQSLSVARPELLPLLRQIKGDPCHMGREDVTMVVQASAPETPQCLLTLRISHNLMACTFLSECTRVEVIAAVL